MIEKPKYEAKFPPMEDVMSWQDLQNYTGLSMQAITKMVDTRRIPFSIAGDFTTPSKIYFQKSKIDPILPFLKYFAENPSPPMPKYKTKSLPVEAYQLTENTRFCKELIPEWVREEMNHGMIRFYDDRIEVLDQNPAAIYPVPYGTYLVQDDEEIYFYYEDDFNEYFETVQE